MAKKTTNSDFLVDPEGTQEAVASIAARKAAGTWPVTEEQLRRAALAAVEPVYEAIYERSTVAVAPTMAGAYDTALRSINAEMAMGITEEQMAEQVARYAAGGQDDNIIVRPVAV